MVVYGGSKDFASYLVTNDACNLMVVWGDATQLETLEPEVELAWRRNGLRFMRIYGADDRASTEDVRRRIGARDLMDNLGEIGGHLYSNRKVAEWVGVPTDMTDLDEARRYFTGKFIGDYVKSRRTAYDFLFSTSGSPLGCHELKGGIDFICTELYATGAMNLAYAMSEARGSARRFGPEYWGGWLAHECQTRAIPFDAPAKFPLLRAGLYQCWMMGTPLIVLESGAQWTQTMGQTVGTKPPQQTFADPVPTAYRREMTDFYKYVREHPRAKGTPATRAALVLGNNDAFVGLNHKGLAVWGQHATAERDPRWRYGAPEDTWTTLQRLVYPLVPDALGGYRNSWLASSPFGQVDVVNVDDDTTAAELSRYDLLVFGGWNTMTPKLFAALAEWTRGGGGELLLCAAHLSTRTDREWENLTTADLVNGGDLRPLIDRRLTDGDLSGGEGGDCGIVAGSCGNGRAQVFLCRGYPGKDTPAADAYAKAAGDALARHVGDVRLVDNECFSWAVNGDELSILNLDCLRARRYAVRVGDREATGELPPAGYRALSISELRK